MHEEVSRHGGSPVFRWSARPLLAVSLVALLSAHRRAEASPFPPQTLWELTLDAERVVWADVEEVARLPPRSAGDGKEEPHWDDGDVARLRVRESWKGAARPGELLEVHFNSGFICPAPARYESGLAVVAFLVRQKGQWRTVGMSYGTRYPTSNAEAEAYRHAVTSAHQAHERWTEVRVSSRAVNMAAARRHWQVLVAAHPATRWDGLYGLVPEADEAHAFHDDRATDVTPLLLAQREQLAEGFVKNPPLDRSLPMMLSALRGHASREVDQAAARALETVLDSEDPPRWATLAFDLLRERHGEKRETRSEPAEDRLMHTLTDASAPDTHAPATSPWGASWAGVCPKRLHRLSTGTAHSPRGTRQ
jgi:hypothetical protein